MTSSATPDVIEALRANPAALSRFEALPPSHKAEYLKWIDEAKRAETRQRRIAGMIDRLTVGTGVPKAVGRVAVLAADRPKRGAR
jgi:uncharacterized protein YdeI (YjbR/CyaY-like superfamily)